MGSIIQENKKQIEEIMQELHLDIFENLTVKQTENILKEKLIQF